MRLNLRNTWTNFNSTLLLFAVFAISIAPARAQSQDRQQDIQQLKDKLQQLEQTMGEVKAEINRLEATTPSTATTPGQKPSAKPQPASEEVVPMEGEITQKQDSVDLYGFVMLDSGYNFGQIDPNWYDVVRPTKLPAYANEFGGNGNVFAGVRQTRFGVKSSTPTHLGDLNTIFEFELFGTGVDAGQTTFRLRHAYGELGKFGAGQYWSAFMDIGVFPNTIEYWGPSGMAFFRNVQVRWMPVKNKRTNVTIALERPGASGDQGVYADRIELANITPRFNFPDLSGHFKMMGNWGYLQTAAIVRKIGWNDTSANTTNLGGSVVGWGINLTSNLNLGKANVARLAYLYGHGIENYMNDAPYDIGIQTNVGVVHNSQGQVVPFKGVALPVTGVVAFLDHTWNEHLTSSGGYSLVNISNADAENPSAFHQGHYALANLLFHPIPKVMMGPEFQFGRRVNFADGFNYNDYRVQFSFKYDWSKSFKSRLSESGRSGKTASESSMPTETRLSDLNRRGQTFQSGPHESGPSYRVRRNTMNTKRTPVALLVVVTVATVVFPVRMSAQTKRSSPVAPRSELVASVIQEAYDKFQHETKGKNADYIPYLAQVDSKLFGIAIVTTDNQVFTKGDVTYSFSIQSISKVYTQALAMEALGADSVFDKIGSEPTGRPFNSPVAVVDMPTHTGNAYVNAGAIATTSLITGKDANEKWNKILNFYSRAAGEKLVLIDEVYKSEAATNTGNKALSMLLAKYDRIYADPFESVDIYTKQCSVGVNATQLARMGATLANNGINPATGEQVIRAQDVPYILSTMTMAGLYDGSGGWAWKVGLPAKSGVGGGIVAIVPGKGAIAVFAPPLDEAGNSVKAQEVIDYVSQKLNYNLYSPLSVGWK